MSDYSQLYTKYEKKFNLPEGILSSIGLNESSNNPKAFSPDSNAAGLMQIIPSNYKALGVTDPYDPEQSVSAAAQILAQNLKATGNDIPQALTMYHGGTNPANYGTKTNDYRGKVMATYNNGKMPTLDEFTAKYGGGDKAPSSAPQMPSLQEFVAKYGGPEQSTTPPSAWQNLKAGFNQGVNDVIDYPVKKALEAGNAMGFNIPNQNDINQAQAQSNDAYNANYGNSDWATAGRLGGQTVATAPVVSLGGAGIAGLLGKGATMLGEGTTGANILNGVRNLLTGTSGIDDTGLAGLGKRMVSRTAQGAMVGGIAGGLTSPAYDQTTGEGAGQGALIGAGMGAVVNPLLGKIAQGAGKLAMPFLSGLTDVSNTQTNRVAVNALTKAFANDGMTLDEGLARMQQMGDKATLADAGGANVKAASRVIAQSPSMGADAASYLGSRMEQLPAEANLAIKTATGQEGNTYDTAAALNEQKRTESKPLYEKAFSQSIPADDHLNAILETPDAQSGLKNGIRYIQNELASNGESFNPADYEIPSTGQVPMKIIDAVKRGLDATVTEGTDPLTGKMNSDAASVNQLRKALLNKVDSISPDYAAARAAFAGPSQSQDAMNLGLRALNLQPEEIANQVSQMPDGSVDYFKNGLAKALMNKVDATPDNADVVKRIFGNQAVKDKLMASFGDENAYNQFADKMANLREFARTKNAVLGGSQTFSNFANAANGADYTPHVLNAITGNPVNGAIGGMGQAIRNSLLPSSKQMAAQGDLMFNPNLEYVQNAIANAAPSTLRKNVSNALTAAPYMARIAEPLGLQYNQNLLSPTKEKVK